MSFGLRCRYTMTVIVLCIGVALMGCAAPAAQPPTNPTKAAPAATPSDAGITITDAANRVIALPQLPKRIVVIGLGPYMSAHLLYMFPEGRERLIGMERRAATASDFLPLIDPNFNAKLFTEASPGPEAIAALNPDLVIIKARTMDKVGEALSQVGIPFMYVWLEGPEYFFADVRNVGTILGNPARAEEIIAYYQGHLNRVATATASLTEKDKPRVLTFQYNQRSGQTSVEVPAQRWIQSLQAQMAGGQPVWFEAAAGAEGWTIVNFEQVARWNPDKIFAIVWRLPDPQGTINSLKADPQWSTLKAVREGQLIAYPQDIYGWETPDPRWILGLAWLAQRMHPDRFADFDMTQEVYRYFGEMYGMSREAIERDILPRVRLNVR